MGSINFSSIASQLRSQALQNRVAQASSNTNQGEGTQAATNNSNNNNTVQGTNNTNSTQQTPAENTALSSAVNNLKFSEIDNRSEVVLNHNLSWEESAGNHVEANYQKKSDGTIKLTENRTNPRNTSTTTYEIGPNGTKTYSRTYRGNDGRVITTTYTEDALGRKSGTKTDNGVTTDLSAEELISIKGQFENLYLVGGRVSNELYQSEKERLNSQYRSDMQAIMDSNDPEELKNARLDATRKEYQMENEIMNIEHHRETRKLDLQIARLQISCNVDRQFLEWQEKLNDESGNNESGNTDTSFKFFE